MGRVERLPVMGLNTMGAVQLSQGEGVGCLFAILTAISSMPYFDGVFSSWKWRYGLSYQSESEQSE